MTRPSTALTSAAILVAGVALWGGSAVAAPLSGTTLLDRAMQGAAPVQDVETDTGLPSRLQRQVVDYATAAAVGTVIIDTTQTHLYFVLGNGRAIRYGIGIGRDGFTWAGSQTVTRKAEWPDWIPPQEMIARQPYLPRWVAGGESNPLGARAIYLGSTVYRIHGTNMPETIGRRVSSGCIRMLNADVVDLYGRVDLGTNVIVLDGGDRVAGAPAAPAAPIRLAVPRSSELRGSAIY